MANSENPTGGAKPSTTKATLGLTGLTVNAMALIAPGAFLWLTFQMQSLYGAPMAGAAMWFGIVRDGGNKEARGSHRRFAEEVRRGRRSRRH